MTISLNEFTCPHCLRENATMEDSGLFVKPINTHLISLVFTCKSCEHSIIIEVDGEASAYYWDVAKNNKNSSLKIRDSLLEGPRGWVGRALFIYPVPEEQTIPEYLSEIVSKNLREAKELFQRNYFNQSGMTSRRVIDLATKELLPEHKGQLNGRIKQLLEKGVITKQLSDWADIIRLDGNSAIHDYDDFSEEEARQLLDFTEMFLMYAFTLPKMVEIKRESPNENN